jgi:hypothetical protein
MLAFEDNVRLNMLFQCHYVIQFKALVEREAASQANLMIAVVIVSAFLIVVIALALVILLYRAKNGDLSLKHKRLVR